MIRINEFIIFNVIPIIVLEALGGVPLRVFQSIREMGRALGLYPYVMIMSIRYYIQLLLRHLGHLDENIKVCLEHLYIIHLSIEQRNPRYCNLYVFANFGFCVRFSAGKFVPRGRVQGVIITKSPVDLSDKLLSINRVSVTVECCEPTQQLIKAKSSSVIPPQCY